MKRQGFFTGRIYDENYDVKNIKECCHMLSDEQCTDEKNEERHNNDLKNRCAGCNGCPESMK